MAQPQKKSSGCGKIFLIIGIILLLIGGGVAAAVYFGYHKLEQTLKSSEAYTIAVKALKENPDIQEKLGEIQDTGFPLGSFNQDVSGSGQANFTMSVHGTKGDGQYHVEMVRRNSMWMLQQGSVRLAHGGTITIAEPGSDSNENTNTNELMPLPPEPSKVKGTINGGVLNSKALTLPQPAYPPVARSAKASGLVVIEVLIDEQGNVISARPMSGHPLLRAAATAAARQAKFSPTKVAGKPVKVSGQITYTFVLE